VCLEAGALEAPARHVVMHLGDAVELEEVVVEDPGDRQEPAGGEVRPDPSDVKILDSRRTRKIGPSSDRRAWRQPGIASGRRTRSR
jgi:hypothetical protein